LSLKACEAISGPSRLFIRRHDIAIAAPGGELEGHVKRVRAFGPTQRADVALEVNGDDVVIEIDAPRDRDLQPGETISLQPRRYRIFAA
jgi:sulfate transport system ATP-binding protein